MQLQEKLAKNSRSSDKIQALSKWKRKEMSPPKQITSEFVHCGLGYSNARRGMLVVENNAVNRLPIKVKKKGGQTED